MFLHLYTVKIQKFAKDHDRNKVISYGKINDGNDGTNLEICFDKIMYLKL